MKMFVTDGQQAARRSSFVDQNQLQYDDYGGSASLTCCWHDAAVDLPVFLCGSMMWQAVWHSFCQASQQVSAVVQ